MLFRAREPKTLVEWYQQTLGVPVETGETYGALFSSDGGGPTVWSAFSTDADYFGRGEQQVMINYRVRNLDAMLAQLRVGRMAAF